MGSPTLVHQGDNWRHPMSHAGQLGLFTTCITARVSRGSAFTTANLGASCHSGISNLPFTMSLEKSVQDFVGE